MEPLHKHLEVCNLAFKSIGMHHESTVMQNNLQVTMDRVESSVQAFFMSMPHPGPDFALRDMMPVGMIQFNATLRIRSSA